MSLAAGDGTIEHRQRVRLTGVQAESVSGGATRVRVTLEWNGREFAGESAGEPAEPLALRTAAAAALGAVAAVAPETAVVRLIGIKRLRAFDADLIVVALSGISPQQKLVGAVLVGEDPLRAAATAVLHALNRLLGNYITVG